MNPTRMPRPLYVSQFLPRLPALPRSLGADVSCASNLACRSSLAVGLTQWILSQRSTLRWRRVNPISSSPDRLRKEVRPQSRVSRADKP
jgi:hypothetical protein